MVEKISKYILEKMKKKDPTITGDSEEVLLFGITRVVEEIPKSLIAILICYILGILKEAAILFLITVMYKKYVGGVHAKTNLGCLISGLVYIFAVVYGSKFIITYDYIRYSIYGIIYIMSIYIIYKYAPADTAEIPIINKELRKKSKIKAFIILNFIYLITFLFIKDIIIINIITYSIFMLNLMTTRIMYKLFKNNYGHEIYDSNLDLIKSN